MLSKGGTLIGQRRVGEAARPSIWEPLDFKGPATAVQSFV